VAATCLALVPGEGQQLLAGTAGGVVLRGARVGAPRAPREFWPCEARPPLRQWELNGADGGGTAGTAMGPCGGGLGAAAGAWGAAVTCLASCPLCPEAFLTGYSDGALALHALGRGAAARVWRGIAAAPLVSVRCATLRNFQFICCRISFARLRRRLSSAAAVW
jgi:hypothetical protein